MSPKLTATLSKLWESVVEYRDRLVSVVVVGCFVGVCVCVCARMRVRARLSIQTVYVNFSSC